MNRKELSKILEEAADFPLERVYKERIEELTHEIKYYRVLALILGLTTALYTIVMLVTI